MSNSMFLCDSLWSREPRRVQHHSLDSDNAFPSALFSHRVFSVNNKRRTSLWAPFSFVSAERTPRNVCLSGAQDCRWYQIDDPASFPSSHHLLTGVYGRRLRRSLNLSAYDRYSAETTHTHSTDTARTDDGISCTTVSAAWSWPYRMSDRDQPSLRHPLCYYKLRQSSASGHLCLLWFWWRRVQHSRQWSSHADIFSVFPLKCHPSSKLWLLLLSVSPLRSCLAGLCNYFSLSHKHPSDFCWGFQRVPTTCRRCPSSCSIFCEATDRSDLKTDEDDSPYLAHFSRSFVPLPVYNTEFQIYPVCDSHSV